MRVLVKYKSGRKIRQWLISSWSESMQGEFFAIAGRKKMIMKELSKENDYINFARECLIYTFRQQENGKLAGRKWVIQKNDTKMGIKIYDKNRIKQINGLMQILRRIQFCQMSLLWILQEQEKNSNMGNIKK